MMLPQRDGDAVIGPFMEATTPEAVGSEMGRLAIQVGEQLNLSSASRLRSLTSPTACEPSGLSLRSARYPGPDTAPEARFRLGRSGLSRGFDLWRLLAEPRFGGTIPPTFSFDLLVAPRAGFDHLAAVDHIM